MGMGKFSWEKANQLKRVFFPELRISSKKDVYFCRVNHNSKLSPWKIYIELAWRTGQSFHARNVKCTFKNNVLSPMPLQGISDNNGLPTKELKTAHLMQLNLGLICALHMLFFNGFVTEGSHRYHSKWTWKFWVPIVIKVKV